MSDGGKTANKPGQALFSNLLASKPPREGGAAAAATTASLIFHGALIAGAVAATVAVGKEVVEEEKVEEVTFVKIEEAPPPPPPPPVEAPPPPPEVTKPRGFQTLTAPEVVPVEIPPPDTVATNEADFSGEGAEGGIAEGEAAPVDTNQTFLSAQVSVIPKMTKVVKPTYPEFLKKMEIQGTVVIQAIIKTDGRVDPASAKVIKKLHPQLDQAALEALTASEFSPALYGARPVRVIMQIPYTFKFK
ncbi:MAG: energy transducer TonB [Gemmatimonadota bacterium]